MSYVRVEQRSAHLATLVRLSTVTGRNGPVSKATFTAISNTWRGSAEGREEESTAILWTLWGKQAENAAQYLSKGSHVNITGRVQNNNYEREGVTVYGMAFTAEQMDYLDSKATSDALRMRQEGQQGEQTDAPGQPKPQAADGASAPRAANARKARKGAERDAVPAGADEDIPF